jgi:uncharacterized protein (TIGR02145 family)
MILLAFILFLLIGCDEKNPVSSDNKLVITDVDGNTYKIVKIGSQLWMTENLKTTRYRNGDTIPCVTDNDEWEILASGAYCEYDNDSNNVATYGRLYNWYAFYDSRNIAPEGWHVPTDTEWQILIDYLGGDNVASGKMKEAGTTHWASPNYGATNESHFTALPGGLRFEDGRYFSMGSEAHFWTNTEYDSYTAFLRYLYCEYFNYANRFIIKKTCGLSVRCVKD